MKSLVEKFNTKLNRDEIRIVLNMVEIGLAILCAICVVVATVKIGQIKDTLDETKVNRGNLDNIESMMLEIKGLYEKYYIKSDIDNGDIEDYALSGFAAGYKDEYGGYISPKLTEEMENERLEKLVGIGVHMMYEGEVGLYIISVYRDSPAEKAGIRAGDYIISAGDTTSENNTNSEMLEAIRGEDGTTVEMGIRRGDEVFTVEVIRSDVKTESVFGKLVGEVAYIKIDKFTEHTDSEFIQCMEEFSSQGIEKYIIDLRNNTGGVANTVINMVDYMVPKGLIARFEFVDSENNTEYYSEASEFNGDIVVLINATSASASELFSQSMKDYGKATVIGVRSYGKGTVCSTYSLSNGGSLMLSAGKYYTLSGVEIEGNGVEPDIEVKMKYADLKILYKLPLDEDNQFLAAYKALTGKDSWE